MSAESITSPKTYLVIYVALLGLLALTIAVSFFDLGPVGIAIAVLIAVCKAALIILYFMNVRGSSHLIWIAAGAAFLWLGIMLAFTLNDYFSRNWLPVPGI